MTYRMGFAPFVRPNGLEMAPLCSAILSCIIFFVFVFVAASTLVRAKPFHLLSQIARLLERPTGAFIAAQPQGRSKHIFTKKAETGKCIEMPFAVTTFPVKKQTSKARRLCWFANIKIILPLEMARAKRRPF